MPIIGEIIKKAVELSDKIIPNPTPKEAQENTLQSLLKTAQNTAFGRHYKFAEILKTDDIIKSFAETVPFHDYYKLKDEWWHKTISGEENITWPGKVNYFAVSSGTTSKRKRIPVTDDMLKSIRRAGLQQIKAIADFDLPAEFFEKEILMFGSSTDLKEVNGHMEGEISGISASQLPFWFEGFYRPGQEIAAINDWDKRVLALAKEAKNWDIGSISGIPSWIELMMKKVMEYHKASNIHEVWPNLQVFTSGGVAFEPYRKSFDKILGKPLTIIDTYLASEGYLATQSRKDTDAMRLITENGIFFEFIPFEVGYIADDGSVRQGAPSIRIEDVEEGKDYVLIISTVSGAWRYMIGDTVKFTNKALGEIKITGRTKHFLNVVGSQLSVLQMNKALEILEEKIGYNIKEFTVAATERKEGYIHQWYLGFDGDIPSNEGEIARQLDEILQKDNKNYKVARNKALKGIDVKAISAGLFRKWTEDTKQKGGQVKVVRVMKTKEFAKWESYISRQ